MIVTGLGFYFKNFGFLKNTALDIKNEVIEEPTPSPSPISMLFVGDIMLGRKVGEKILEVGDFKYPFLKIAEFLKSADLTMGNLEGPISSRGIKVGSIYSFRFDPRVTEGLKFAGFDLVSLANNHIWDYGRVAFLDTMSHLASAGIDFVGIGYSFNEAHEGVTKTIGDTKINFLAYTDLISKSVSATATEPGVSYLDRAQMVADIKQAKIYNDLVVVNFHMGDEYETKHNQNQDIIYKEAIDAGADLVIGHHPHVVQEVEKYKQGWIAYSLGNFIFDQNFSEATMSGLAIRATINNKKIEKLEQFKIKISADHQAEVVITPK